MIGIFGGCGSIGFEAAKILQHIFKDEVIIGGRNPEKMDVLKKEVLKSESLYKIDIEKMDGVIRFMEKCKVILNCTGSSKEVTKVLAEAAKNRKIHFIDLGSNEQLERELHIEKSSIILSAGSLPGLSALMPRYLARNCKNPKKIQFYYKGVGRFSYTSAREYLDGLYEKNKRVMVKYSHGAVLPFHPQNMTDETFPYNKGRIYPYFDEEAEYIAKSLSLEQGRWNMVMEGKHTLDVLYSAKNQYESQPEKTIEQLKAASILDLFDEEPHVEMMVELSGENDIYTMMIGSGSPEKLTGIMAGITAHLLLFDQLPKGIYTLGKCPCIEPIIDHLKQLKKEVILQIEPMSLNEVQASFQGEI